MVKGLHTKTELTADFAEKYSFDVKLKEKDIVNINRILQRYESGYSIALFDEEGLSQGNKFFDSEFYYRDGYFEAPTTRREGHEGYNFGDKQGNFFYVAKQDGTTVPAVVRVNSDGSISGQTIQRLVSPRCHQSYVYVRM